MSQSAAGSTRRRQGGWRKARGEEGTCGGCGKRRRRLTGEAAMRQGVRGGTRDEGRGTGDGGRGTGDGGRGTGGGGDVLTWRGHRACVAGRGSAPARVRLTLRLTLSL